MKRSAGNKIQANTVQERRKSKQQQARCRRYRHRKDLQETPVILPRLRMTCAPEACRSIPPQVDNTVTHISATVGHGCFTLEDHLARVAPVPHAPPLGLDSALARVGGELVLEADGALPTAAKNEKAG